MVQRDATPQISTLWVACTRSERHRERAGYFSAFEKKGLQLNFLDSPAACSALQDSLESQHLEFVLYPDPPITPMPAWLPHKNAIAICIQIDAMGRPDWKALWSSLFDYLVLYRPGLGKYYDRYGHRGVMVMPIAVDRSQYENLAEHRIYDVGWVGSLTGAIYATRRELLPKLASRYKMNNFESAYPEEQVPQIYKRSRIVLNINRDDYPTDANTRCVEAMAAGALLITPVPTELESFGFIEGQHFVGYQDKAKIFELIDKYLKDESERRRIADAGRELVLSRHTYDIRVSELLSVLASSGDLRLAPARRWTAARIDYVYCHYYCKRSLLAPALRRLRRVARLNPLAALRLLPYVARCAWHRMRARLATMRKIKQTMWLPL